MDFLSQYPVVALCGCASAQMLLLAATLEFGSEIISFVRHLRDNDSEE